MLRWTGATAEEVDTSISIIILRTSPLAIPDFSSTSKEILDRFPNQENQKALKAISERKWTK